MSVQNKSETTDVGPTAVGFSASSPYAHSRTVYEDVASPDKTKRNKLYPAMTKMVAVVKAKVRRISPGDDESGVDSDNETIEEDAELSGQLQREKNDSSGHGRRRKWSYSD
ncbi:hypothetical protein JCM33374_g1910 [Metschnikowia sp. JCM 33374]|nr:hypothetical protein JCM33374_g1910 [Metschnikowia sp. JCM 33374]